MCARDTTVARGIAKFCVDVLVLRGGVRMCGCATVDLLFLRLDCSESGS